jgi:DNA transposition AAA+ family ATPase
VKTQVDMTGDDLISATDTGDLPANFKPTASFRQVIEAVELARTRQRKMLLITGAHGVGKSMTMRFYTRRRFGRYMECRPSYQPRHLVQDLCKLLGVLAGEGWSLSTSALANHLKASPKVVVLDEAQRLNYGGFDVLKYLADQAPGTLFVLLSSPSLSRRMDRWPDISSRCTMRVAVEPLSVDEFVELFQGEGFSLEALEEIHRISGGVLRVIGDLLEQIDIDLKTYAELGGNSIARGDLSATNIMESAVKVVDGAHLPIKGSKL